MKSEMKENKQLKRIDELILNDIREHPGTSQEQVCKRLYKYYRARTYIINTISRLRAIGSIKAERVGNTVHLTCE